MQHYAMGKDELFEAISGRLTRHIIKLAETATKGTSSSQAVQKLLSNKMTVCDNRHHLLCVTLSITQSFLNIIHFSNIDILYF